MGISRSDILKALVAECGLAGPMWGATGRADARPIEHDENSDSSEKSLILVLGVPEQGPHNLPVKEKANA